MKRRRSPRDFQSEIESHIELEADRLCADGVPPGEARAAALRAFGNRTIAEERFYEAGRWMPWENLVRDLRFAFRVLAKDASFSTLAVLGLALGIGVSTAIFAIVNAAIRSETGAVQDSAALVGISRVIDHRPGGLSSAEYRYLREQATSFRDITAQSGRERFVLAPWKPGAEAEEVQCRFVSANFLSAAGLHPALGRSFTRQEEQGASVVVLAFRYWKTRFAGDPAVLGSTVMLNAHAFTVAGVADARWGASDVTDFYLPLGLAHMEDPDARWLTVDAWMRPGVALPQARAEMEVLGAAAGAAFELTPGAINPRKRREILTVIYAVTIAVSMILLIACSNLANLLLARAVMRGREIGVRLSLGASRARLVAQLLTESLLLAIAGGALGVAFSHWLARFLLSVANAGPGLAFDILPDPRVVLYGLLLSLASGLSFGLPAALAATRASVRSALAGDTRVQGGGPRNLLVTVPMAVSVMLLLGAGIEVRNVQRTYFHGPAFDATHLMSAAFRLHKQGYDEARTRAFEERLRERISAMPGVVSVAMATSMPLSNGYGRFRMESDRMQLGADYNIVSPDYFATIGAAMTRGRGFTQDDRAGTVPVALVNEELSRTNWPGEESIGKRIRLAAGGTWFEIVGVAPDLEDAAQRFNSVRPTVYIPFTQARLFTGATPAEAQLLIRTRGEMAALKAAVRQEVHAADPSLLMELRTIEEMLEAQVGPMKTISMLLGALGGLALLMAAVGIYAILAHAVSRRTREIGIRSALGASHGQILAVVMRQTAVSIAWGIAGGLAAALVLTRIFAHAMAKFGELDAATCAAVSLLLAAVALVASWLPARKALRVDPAQALRWE